MTEPVYQVVWPLGKSVYEDLPIADEIPDLSGKTVCELWDWLFKGDEVFSILREVLARQHPGVKFVDYTQFGNTAGRNEREVVAALAERLREHRCDAVISGIGA